MTQPEITLDQAKDIVATKTAPRVTEADIINKIANVRYHRDDFTTIAIITTQAGFKVIGHSTPASQENFDILVGRRYAYDNAFKQLWQLEGYLLVECLWNGWNGY